MLLKVHLYVFPTDTVSKLSCEMNEEISRSYLWLHTRRQVFKQNFCYSSVLFLS